MGTKSELRVSANVDAKNLADSIRMGFTDGASSVQLHAIGAVAVNQAVKAIAIVRRHHKLPVVAAPSFTEIEDADRGVITGIKLDVTVAA